VKVGDEVDQEGPRVDKAEVPGVAQSEKSFQSSPTRRLYYTTTRPFDISIPYDQLKANDVVFGAPDKRPLKMINTLLIFFLYVGLIVGLLGRFSLKLPQRSTGRLRNRKGLLSGGGKDQDSGGAIMFADVAGVDEAKEELEEIVEFLKNPDRYTRLGARPPRGVLLVGPPGTGKTLLAKAVAGEADVPFISCSASEFVELYVGMGASRVRDLFARAKKEAPSIVFIDEIDAVAKGRDGRLRSVGNDEREQTLNQLLTELDGFESSSTVIVLGATNRADVLDPALRRPGRFDRIVMVEPPDRQGREEILKVHVTKKQLPLAPDVNLNVIAAATAGFTGADLANLVNEAALLAGRASKLVVGDLEFSQAVERAIAGIEKKRSTLHGSEKGVVARHEAGHAVVGTAVAKFIPGLTRVQKLSILPRSGGALGFTYIPPGAEDRNLLFIDELRGRLVILLGGRAAEEVVYHGRVSTGALDDIKRATDLAYKAVAEYGLSSTIGPISISTLSGGGLDETGGSFTWGKDQGRMADMVQNEVRSLMQSALEAALLVIRSNPTALEGLGAQLEAEERLEGAILEDWLNTVNAPMELAAFIRGRN
jgi:cell division protease FtsH